MNLIEQFESRCGALRVNDLTEPLGVDDKTIYRMAARGQIPSFRLGGAIRFDPQEIAKWLRTKYGAPLPQRMPVGSVRPQSRSRRRLA